MVIDHTRQASLDSAAILKHSTVALEDGLMREGSDWIPEGRGFVDDAMPIAGVFERAPVLGTRPYCDTWLIHDPRIENMLEYTIVLIGCTDSETGRGLSQLLPMPRDVSPEVIEYHGHESGSRALLRRERQPSRPGWWVQAYKAHLGPSRLDLGPGYANL